LYIEQTTVQSIQKLGKTIYLLKVHAPIIAKAIKPGQFCNIKVSESDFPLLRRPFSVCDVEEESVFFMFDVIGEGTKILSYKKAGDTLDILGPLGNGFDFSGNYQNAMIVAGGIGVAPFPYLTKYLDTKKVFTFIGAKTFNMIIRERLKNIFVSTDDGSEGFHGTVIDLMKEKIVTLNIQSLRIFACGPNPMLKALQSVSIQNNYDCQISVESAMACGFGICQGCTIETYEDGLYKLICKDGPVFNARDVRL
jgi:dihydroorotate dehydrogenase electron transfer subunit